MSGVRIPMNLASSPFRRDRPMLVASAATAVLLAAVLAMLLSIVFHQREAAAESRAMLARLDAQLRALNAEHSRLEGQLRQPANAAVLDRNAFLNLLLQRKGISWTRLFSDLESVFPGAVRLVAIRPHVTADNRVQLDMVVGAQSPEPVIELLQRLEGAPAFGATSVLSSQPPSQNEPLYRYRVSVDYAQKL
jgi:type IV pilus assembly protein PilN